MKGTRLWQDTGSPLISGRSRRDRPLTFDVLVGWASGVVAGGVASLAFSGSADVLVISGLALPKGAATAVGAFGVAIVPALLGACIGAYIGKKMGYLRPWTAAALASVVVAVAFSAFLALTHTSITF